MKTVTLFHSQICPRCQVSKRLLAGLEPDFPEVRVERVEYLTNLGRARDAGVRSIPTLVCGERKLSGIVLTKKSMRRFLEAL